MNTSATTSTMITNRNTTAITVRVRSITARISPARLIICAASACSKCRRTGQVAALSFGGSALGKQRIEFLQRSRRRLAATVETGRPLQPDAFQLLLHLDAGFLRQRLERDAGLLKALARSLLLLVDIGTD